MNILFYVGYFDTPWLATDAITEGKGGTETSIVQLSRAFKAQGDTVTVAGQVTTHNGGVNYINLDEVALDSHYDVVIGVGYIHYIKELERRCVTYDKSFLWLHNISPYNGWRGSYMVDWEKEYLDPRMTGIVCVSEYHKNRFVTEYPHLKYKTRYVDNAIDQLLFHEDVPKQAKLIWTSAPDRGLHRALVLWHKLILKYPLSEFVVCFPSYASIGTELDELLNHHSITVRHSLSKVELYSELNDSFIWFYPTTYEETFCIAALEAMRTKAHVLTTDCGNLSSLLNYGHWGTLMDINATDHEWLDMISKMVEPSSDTSFDVKRDRAFKYAISQEWSTRVMDWKEIINTKTATFEGDALTSIYIIALDDSPLSRRRWNDELIKCGLSHIPMTVVPAIRGTDLDFMNLHEMSVELYPHWNIGGSNEWWNRPMTAGEIGCALSHLSVWDRIAKSRHPGRFLILEEDFVATESTSIFEIVNVAPIDHDMVYLGRVKLDPTSQEYPMNHAYCMPAASYNLHSYMLSSVGARKLSQSNFRRNLMPVDDWIIGTYNFHPRPDIQLLDHPIMNTYACTYQLFDQLSNPSTSTTSHTTSDDNHLSTPQLPNAACDIIGPTHDDPRPISVLNYESNQIEWIQTFIQPAVVAGRWELIVTEPIDHVFELNFFTPEFCRQVINLAIDNGGWSDDRHEFYPTNDIILENLELEGMYNFILNTWIYPLTRYLFELEGDEWLNMSSENFIVQYTQGEFLDVHHDDSKVTALVNLSKFSNYEGGGTWFTKKQFLSKPHEGTLTLHPGNITHKHGAKPVISGSRYVITSFMNTNMR